MLLGALAHSPARSRLLDMTRSELNAVTAGWYMLLPELAPTLQPVLGCLERVFLHVSMYTASPLAALAPYAYTQYWLLCRLLRRLTLNLSSGQTRTGHGPL